jgi:dipeptidyl aminopeptidase/acylaminoacyl peptidase
MVAGASDDSSPQPLVTDRGSVGSLIWSRDGKRLAFVSHRGSHSLIGVYDLVRHTVVWLAPSLDEDASPVFSPDGARLAFIRVAAEKHGAFITHRIGEPWSIWVADAATGVGRRIWAADAGAGSVFAATLSSRNLLWGAGDQLIFPWEKTGWRHLYSVSAAGGAARSLTSGAFEVETLALSPDGGQVVYTSNQGDLDRAHVWSVSLANGRATRVSEDRGVQIYPSTGSDGTLYALQSDATKSLQPVVLRDGHWQPLAPEAIPPDFPTSELVTPQTVTFLAADGKLVHGQLFVPRENSKTPRAAVLFFHGGPQRQMLLGFHPMSAYNRLYAENQYLASKGYIVLSVNYRGGIGYGLDFREAENSGPGGGSEFNDLLGAVAFLKARKDVDARRLGMYGASYGGLMVALGLARASDDIAAGVDYAGVYNWSTMLTQIGIAPTNEAAAQLAMMSSPVSTIDRWKSPVLIVQADDDRNVPPAQASELIMDLRSRGIPYEQLMLPDEVHDMTRYASWMRLFHATEDFFERHLAHR